MIRQLRKQLRKNRGFTLVELMIVVAIVGILAALAIYGVRKYMANAKTAEARNSLGQLSKDAVTAYFKEGMGATVMELGTTRGVVNKLSDGTGVKSVPTSADPIKRQKYQSKPADWDTWDCLHFSMNDPQYYMYSYKTEGDLSKEDSGKFTGIANGDLDGDGTLSTFYVFGGVKKDDKGNVTAVAGPNIEENAADE